MFTMWHLFCRLFPFLILCALLGIFSFFLIGIDDLLQDNMLLDIVLLHKACARVKKASIAVIHSLIGPVACCVYRNIFIDLAPVFHLETGEVYKGNNSTILLKVNE